MVTHQDELNNTTYLCDEKLVQVCNDAIFYGELNNYYVSREEVVNVITTFPSTDTRNKDKIIKYAHER